MFYFLKAQADNGTKLMTTAFFNERHFYWGTKCSLIVLQMKKYKRDFNWGFL